MNAIITWVAINNTLLIRIGFSAVVILVLVYIFRFFFMPPVSVVKDEGVGSGLSKAVDGQQNRSDMNIEELAELQLEVESLKSELKKAIDEKSRIVANASNLSAAAGASALGTAGQSIQEGADLTTPTALSNKNNMQEDVEQKLATDSALTKKLSDLEARLSEYEIIAEDIAEIGKLKQENENLKIKIAEIESEYNETLRALDKKQESNSLSVKSNIEIEKPQTKIITSKSFNGENSEMQIIQSQAEELTVDDQSLGEKNEDEAVLDMIESLNAETPDSELEALESYVANSNAEQVEIAATQVAQSDDLQDLLTASQDGTPERDAQSIADEVLAAMMPTEPPISDARVTSPTGNSGQDLSQIVIQGDVEVNDEEKINLNDFERFAAAKKG